jgi:hypothetical protein
MRRRSPAILAAVFLAATQLGCDGGDGDIGDACETNAGCDADLYCEKPSGECDAPGACQIRTMVCPAVEAPVCGCDGVTHGNACLAAGAGASVRSVGPCP